MTRTVASAFPQDPQRKLRALAFSEVREIMKLEFGDYDAGPTYAAVQQSVIDGRATYDEAVSAILTTALTTAQALVPSVRA